MEVFCRQKYFSSNKSNVCDEGGGQVWLQPEQIRVSTIWLKAGPRGRQLCWRGGAVPPDARSCKRRQTTRARIVLSWLFQQPQHFGGWLSIGGRDGVVHHDAGGDHHGGKE